MRRDMRKEKTFKLKNVYTGEIVMSSNMFEESVIDGVSFIEVYKPDFPNKKYKVNKQSFVKI